jgi:hypothetical protein
MNEICITHWGQHDRGDVVLFITTMNRPRMNTFPSVLTARENGSTKTCKINDYNWQSSRQFQIENH